MAPVFWIAGWLAITVIALIWLWLLGALEPKRARCVLA